MKQFKIKENYLLLKKWWETIDLTNYEKSFFNREIISFNQQLFRLKEKKIRIGAYGKSGVGKSSVLNSLLKKDIFKTDIINGTTKAIQAEKWNIKDKTKPTDDELKAKESDADKLEKNAIVIDNRKAEYGSVESQIEYITENGIDKWKEKVDAIKKKYPKES